MIGDESMHYKDCRSGELVNGIERSAHRALLYSTGLDEEDLKKPLIAVVNSYTEMVPGHYHLRELVEFVKLGVAEAWGVAREFSTIAICDGICQGHKGMRYPLPSREIIADSMEYMIEAHQFDGMVLMPGCDKIVPGMLMAAMRLNIPAIVLPGGPMMPGKHKGKELTLTDMRELIGQTRTGKLSEEELLQIERGPARRGHLRHAGDGQHHELSGRGDRHVSARLRPGPRGVRQKAPPGQAVRPPHRGDGEGGPHPPEDHDPGGPAQRYCRQYGHGRLHQLDAAYPRHSPRGGYRAGL